MVLLQQLGDTGLVNVNWDTLTIPTLLGMGIILLIREVYYQRKSLKEKDVIIQELNDKRLEDVRSFSESLREISEETTEGFNKVITFLQIQKAENNASK